MSLGIPLPLKASSQTKPSPKISPRSTRLYPTKETLKSCTNASLTSKTDSPSKSDHDSKTTSAKRSLELQFFTKKRRLEQLKRDLLGKQQPVLEMYQNLKQMKKKLEETGKTVVLDTMKFIEFDDEKSKSTAEKIDLSGAGETIKKQLDPELVKTMRESIKKIPQSLLEVCKNVMTKRAAIINLLENETFENRDKDHKMKQIELLKTESVILERNVEDTFANQEKQLNDIISNWQFHLGSVYSKETEAELRKKLSAQEQILINITSDLQKAQMKLRDGDSREELAKAQTEVDFLRDRMKVREILLLLPKLTSTDYCRF